MSRRAYPSYKQSGVEWLPAIPENWQCQRGRYIGKVNPSSPRFRALPRDQEFSVVPMDNVGEWGGLRLDIKAMKAEFESSSLTEFQDGDVVVAKITPCFENGKGAIASGLQNGAALGTTELHVWRPFKSTDVRFLFYLTIAHSFRELGASEMYGAGGQKRVPPEFLKNLKLGLPPFEEQTQIADFLDRETAKIDSLVAKKQELIERLKEKRTALISYVVTKGLPPEEAAKHGLPVNPRLRPSGVSWLGDIPAHRGATQLRRHVRFLTSGSRGWAEHYSTSGSLFVRIGNLTRGSLGVDLSDVQYVMPPEGTEGERTRIKLLDLLLSITAYLGSVAVATDAIEGGFVSQHIALVRLNDRNLYPYFAGFAMLADVGQKQLIESGYGGTKIQLALEDVKTIWIPVPPLVEQQAIVSFLTERIQSIDDLVVSVQIAIEKLKELRSALITAAVTGKIDVREEATA